ncbi:MAG TPA: hypothetical protein VGF76_03915 [Polyangiaceae bacterium]
MIVLVLALGCGGTAASVTEGGGASSVPGSSASGGSGGSSARGDARAGSSASVSGGAAGDASAGAAGDGQDQCTIPYCPISGLSVFAAGGGPVNGVQATLKGAKTTTLSCPTSDEYSDETLCTFPDDFDTAGTYSLHVAADGFQSSDMSVKVMITPVGNPCTCPGPWLTPSVVTLIPSSM